MAQELGTLVVVILKARNLHDKHSFYKQDVYAQLSLNGTTHTTPVDIKGGQHPVWDAEIRLPVLRGLGEKHRILEVSCWAKEKREDDLKGIGKVDISETLRTGEFDNWVGLEMNGAHRGEVYLEMTYYAAAPVPLTRRPSKFNSTERLARLPPSLPSKITGSPSHRPISSQGLSTSPKSYLLPPSPARSPSPSSSPRSRDHHLPPSPARSPSPSSYPQSRGHHIPDEPLKSVPPILRPGHPQSSIPVTRASPSGRSRYPSDPPPDYDTLYPDHADPLASVSEIWQTPRTTPSPDQFSFPVPTPSGANHTMPGYDDYGPVSQDLGLGLLDPYLASRSAYPRHALDNPQDELLQRTILVEEEARRQAQEDEDRRLARQLDRELNSGSLELPRGVSGHVTQDGNGSEGHSTGMPGGWW